MLFVMKYKVKSVFVVFPFLIDLKMLLWFLIALIFKEKP